MTPEERARQNINAQLTAAGWVVQERDAANLSVTSADFQVGALFDRGGWIAAKRLFRTELPVLLEKLNEALAI